MPIQNYAAAMGNAAEFAQMPVNALMQRREFDSEQARRNALTANATREMEEDALFDQALQSGDFDTAMRIDPQTTQLYMAHKKQERMSGLGEIPITAKRIDEGAIQDQYNEERKFAATQRNSDRSYQLQAAQERRLSAPPKTDDEFARYQAMTPEQRDLYDRMKGKQGSAAKPLPVGALRIVDDANQALASTGVSTAIVDRAIAALESGKVQLGAIRNAESRARNFAGKSDENSRAYADLQQTLEKLRNNYLLLAKGVQTEGDAQRAWNSEIGESVQNDNALALQQLKKAKDMTQRAADAQNNRIGTVRSNYGQDAPADGDNDPLGLFK
jgi:hypothetical protein